MGEMLMAIIFFLAILAVATVAFWVWLAAVMLRMAGRVLRAILGAIFLEAPSPRIVAEETTCPRVGCRAANAPGARFCRRCGHELLRGEVRAVRRAAMW